VTQCRVPYWSLRVVTCSLARETRAGEGLRPITPLCSGERVTSQLCARVGYYGAITRGRTPDREGRALSKGQGGRPWFARPGLNYFFVGACASAEFGHFLFFEPLLSDKDSGRVSIRLYANRSSQAVPAAGQGRFLLRRAVANGSGSGSAVAEAIR